MSQENVELTRAGYDAVNRGDIDGLLDICAPGVEWDDTAALDAPPVTGKEAVRAYFKTVLEPFADFRREPEEIIDLGDDRVLVWFHMTARGKGSGIAVEARGGDLLTIKDGKLVRWEAYAQREQALEAAGLSE
jgi:ketosteroid isomerase-like protein